jgi:hypothetical protein
MADNNLAEKLAAMTCEGCRKGWKLLSDGDHSIPSAFTAGYMGTPCISKAPELLTLVGEVEAAAYGRAAQIADSWKDTTAPFKSEPAKGMRVAGKLIAEEIRALSPVGLAEHDRKIRLEEHNLACRVCSRPQQPNMEGKRVPCKRRDELEAALRREEPR